MNVGAGVAGVLGGCFRVPDGSPVDEWASRNVYLRPKATETPGYYDPTRTPYARIITEWFQNDYANPELWFMKSSRTGGTEAALNCVRWMPRNRPGRVLYAIETAEKAKDVLANRLLPTIRDVASEFLTGNEDDLGRLKLTLRNMIIEVAGAGSESPFTEKQVLFGVLDEVEQHELNKQAGASGTTVELMRSRFPTSPGAKMLVISKPVLAGGIMDEGWKSGTMEVYEVPCPQCGKFQELVPENLRFAQCKDVFSGWDLERVQREAYYECGGCAAALEWHRDQRGMIAEGRWRATRDDGVPGRRSAQISDLYSPYDAVSWGRLALRVVEASGNDRRRQFVVNNHWGRAWAAKALERHDEDLLRLRAGAVHPDTKEPLGIEYLWGVEPAERRLPIVPALLVIAIDVQRTCLKYVVGAFAADGELWLIDYGDPVDDEQLEATVLDRVWLDPAGGEHRIQMGWRDAGDQKLQQVDWCLKTFDRYRIWPSRGEGSRRARSPVWMKIETYEQRTYQIYYYQDSALKERLYLEQIGEQRRPRLWFPTDLDRHPGFMFELCNERRVLKWVNGYPVWKWELPSGKPNDYGDCCKMLYGIWMEVGERVRVEAAAAAKDEPGADGTADGGARTN